MLKINEIFKSIQGESTYAGLPCTFVRLAGCNLRCTYCDTNYAYYDGKEITDEDIVAKIDEYGVKCVEFTGGEPMLQEETPKLIKTLLDKGYNVLIETNGSICIGCLDKRLNIIMDYKTPGSNMSERMRPKNFEFLKPTDQIKFVLMNESDYIWAKNIIIENKLTDKFENILMSPAYGELSPKSLVEWILKDGLQVRVQLQIHKYIWAPDEREGV
ncbi:MAG TPA: radical SAM protein [Nitrospirae bacterium]|nr:7-carboxy-7-deazaguanine synthase [bacterium BMS3Abin09]GBE40619.1 7-carboxy-7-deazaguanine synthase [bacterium BMS3Bbin09]HDN94997.1 radical SAM protein [Nitrospirota bacterium]HDO66941.1 radical SAM protein [Nitrospirota bacterium]HDZ83885.1 radical SAM protein [Nitrospirota bacterium]